MNLQEKAVFFSQQPFYFVTCEALSEGRRDEEVVEQALLGGIRLIQLRDKLSTKKTLFEKAKRIRTMTQAYGALFIINDHLDIALSVGADGLHLGQEDLPVREARTLSKQMNHSLLIGLSTHHTREISEAMKLDLDYINIGPIHATQTKENKYPPVGISFVKNIADQIKVPFSVMGGIKKKDLPLLWDLEEPASSKDKSLIQPLAMVTEICQQKEIALFVKELMVIYDQKVNSRFDEISVSMSSS